MSQIISLKEAERRAFRSTLNDGLWDVLLGCFVLILALAPLLSSALGDFWSSFIFLPFWGVAWLGIRWLRRRLVLPRLGVMRPGAARRRRLRTLQLLLLACNLLLLALGAAAVLFFRQIPGLLSAALMGGVLAAGFSAAAWLLDFPRLAAYGLLCGLAPLAGEWFAASRGAAHHGYPLAFGVSAALMILTGTALFARLLLSAPVDGSAEPGA